MPENDLRSILLNKPVNPGPFLPNPNAQDRPDPLSVPADFIKGLVGLNRNSTGRVVDGQSAKLSTPNAIGQVLGAAFPIAGAVRTKILGEAEPASMVLGNFLSHAEPVPVDPLKVIQQSKATSTLVPPAGKIKVPEGFTLAGKQEMARPPALEGKRSLQQEVLERVKASKTPVTKPLTGKWGGRAKNSVETRAKLTVDDVREIKRMQQAGKTKEEINERFPQVKINTIHGIMTGQSWNSVKP